MKLELRLREVNEFQVDGIEGIEDIKKQLGFEKNDIITIQKKVFWDSEDKSENNTYVKFLRNIFKRGSEDVRSSHFTYDFPRITFKEYTRYLWWWQIVSDNSNRIEGWKFALGLITEEELGIPKFTTEGLPQDICDLID